MAYLCAYVYILVKTNLYPTGGTKGIKSEESNAMNLVLCVSSCKEMEDNTMQRKKSSTSAGIEPSTTSTYEKLTEITCNSVISNDA